MLLQPALLTRQTQVSPLLVCSRAWVITCGRSTGRLATPGVRQRRKPADEGKLRKVRLGKPCLAVPLC